MKKFEGFGKIPRLSKKCIITEKIDGTNAQICITEEGGFLVGSRRRWITPENDNYGFARWAYENKEELLKLGVGSHFGEWWGQGIQRKYGKDEKVFSLFNVNRWHDGNVPRLISIHPKTKEEKYTEESPNCCSVVPILYEGEFDTSIVNDALDNLEVQGSIASPGYMNPEGIIVYHIAAGQLFKKTFDDNHKEMTNG